MFDLRSHTELRSFRMSLEGRSSSHLADFAHIACEVALYVPAFIQWEILRLLTTTCYLKNSC